jgi:predicted nucleic acid-binding protein
MLQLYKGSSLNPAGNMIIHTLLYSQRTKTWWAVNSYTNMQKVSNRWRDYSKTAVEAGKAAIDFVDALSLAVMRRERIDEVYSNDKDFDGILGIKRVFE